MSAWPRPSGLTDTACAAPVTPSAETPARATYSDFCLNVFMVLFDSLELLFKVITLNAYNVQMLLQLVGSAKLFGTRPDYPCVNPATPATYSRYTNMPAHLEDPGFLDRVTTPASPCGRR